MCKCGHDTLDHVDFYTSEWRSCIIENCSCDGFEEDESIYNGNGHV